jgi:dTDP-4-dehydrorhamnose reductase
MLGQDVVALLESRGDTVARFTREDVDIADPESIRGMADGAAVLVNCAAYTAVDAAEEDEATAFTVNAVGPANLAALARAAGARLVQISTDYVFDGLAATPYAEDAPLAPRSAYGRTKAAGEWAVRADGVDHLILRTAWLYGANGRCFPKTMTRIVAERGGAQVVEDQWGQPTWTVDVADLLYRLVVADAPRGTYHATASGSTTWFEFARAAVASAGLDPDAVTPTESASFVRPAPRPAYSVLGHEALERLGIASIGDWRDRWARAARSVLGGGAAGVQPAV